MKRQVKYVLLALVAIAFVFNATACTGRPEAGDACVVRNGGPFDNHNIRQTLKPGTGTAWVGLGSTVHCYPAAFQQRYYTITSNANQGDQPGVDVVNVQTADGVLMGIEGTFYFNTAWDFSKDPKRADVMLRAFDTQFGTRKFPDGKGNVYYPWEGDKGLGAFENTLIRPQINNELRQALLRFNCSQVVSSCALIQNNGTVTVVNKKSAKATNVNLQQIQDDVDSGLKTDIKNVLGEDFLTNIHFQLVRPTLPGNIQEAINEAQAAFASVAKATAAKQAAVQQKLAAEQLAKVYQSSPQLAEIEQLKILCGGSASSGTLTSKGCNGATVILGINPNLNVTTK